MSDREELARRLQLVASCEADGDVEALIRLLSDGRERGRVSVRGAAALALGRLGDQRAAPALASLLNDPSHTVRMLAADALGEAGTSHSRAALVTALSDPEVVVRMFAAKSLGGLKGPETVKPLTAALHDPDPWMALYAAEALVSLGRPPAEDIRAAAARDTGLKWGRRRRWRRVIEAL